MTKSVGDTKAKSTKKAVSKKSTTTKSIKIAGNGSKKHKANLAKRAAVGVEIMTVEQAVETLLSMEHPKFKDGASVELHFKLNINPTKSDQLIRASAVLPHGNGKQIKVAAFVNPENEKTANASGADIVGGEELIAQIQKSGKIDFDAAVAEPEMMKKLGPIARVLGTAGVMPTPKNQTVGSDVAGMIKVLKSGKIDIKNDKSGNLHLLVGKINKSFDAAKLTDNIKAVMDVVEKSKPEVIKKKFIMSAHIASTMSPSLRII